MLSIVATPIGNLGDMSPRGVDALREADVIACEDTRRTRILLSHFNIPSPGIFLSYREGNEERVGAHLLALLREGRKVALCSDSGCPGISDPGYRLIRLAVTNGVPMEVIPGPSAVHVALLLSGLPTSSYTFKGYPPRKPGPLRRFFEEEKSAPHTLVIFESPFRVAASLHAALEVLGDRPAAVCIELTKKFERVSRGLLSALAAEYAEAKIKGEVTIVIAGDKPKLMRRESCSEAAQGVSGVYEDEAGRKQLTGKRITAP
jgi:16S rRNA (cytidine1402-2'-O)-methyltransferase